MNILIQKIVFIKDKDLYLNIFAGNYNGALKGYVKTASTTPSTAEIKFPCYYISGKINAEKMQLLIYNVKEFENDNFVIDKVEKIIGTPQELYPILKEKNIADTLSSIYIQSFKKKLF